VGYLFLPGLRCPFLFPVRLKNKKKQKKENIAVANIIEQHTQLHLALCASTVKGSS
jgi:hypothetical protein